MISDVGFRKWVPVLATPRKACVKPLQSLQSRKPNFQIIYSRSSVNDIFKQNPIKLQLQIQQRGWRTEAGKLFFPRIFRIAFSNSDASTWVNLQHSWLRESISRCGTCELPWGVANRSLATGPGTSLAEEQVARSGAASQPLRFLRGRCPYLGGSWTTAITGG